LKLFQNLRKTFEGIVDPLLSAIRRELSYIIAKLHRIDFANKSERGMGGPSSYIKELTEKLSFIKSEILARFSLGNFEQTWCVILVLRLTSSAELWVGLLPS